MELIAADSVAPGAGTHGHPPPGERRPRLPRGVGPRGPAGDDRIDVEVEEVPASTWQRASDAPLWGVLEPTPLPSGEPMRHWREAFADAVPASCAAAPRRGRRHGSG